MQSESKIRTIQYICWFGAAVDMLWAIALIFPRLYGLLTGNNMIDVDLSIRLIMATEAALMAGWSLLLLWVSQHPVQRRAILLITIMPVLASLMVITLTGMFNGHAENIWIFIKCVFLTVAMAIAYFFACTAAREVCP